MLESKRKRIRNILSIVKFSLLLAIIMFVPLYIYFAHPEIADNFKSLENVNAFLERYSTASVFVYIGLQVVQIVISVIPGQALQFAAGYAYSLWLALLSSLAGICLGTVITFYLAKFLGRDAMHLIFGEKKLHEFVSLLNSKKAYTVLFLIFLIPGLPKDLFSYAAGISKMNMSVFLIISMTARAPALIGSLVIGRMFRNESYTGMIILIAAAVILCVLGLFFRNKILSFADRYYEKFSVK